VLQFVASLRNYNIYHDTDRGNYKIHNGFTVVSNPSTIEDAYAKMRLYANSVDNKNVRRCWEGCTSTNCNDCERFL
jgi:hypothetical protein